MEENKAYVPGDMIIIKRGSYKGGRGLVKYVNQYQKKYVVEILNRAVPMPVEVGFSEVVY